MFEVEREIAAKVGASSIHFVDFIFVEPDAIKPTDSETATQKDDHEQGSRFMSFNKWHDRRFFGLGGKCHR
jgi:hypothetical protein